MRGMLVPWSNMQLTVYKDNDGRGLVFWAVERHPAFEFIGTGLFSECKVHQLQDDHF